MVETTDMKVMRYVGVLRTLAKALFDIDRHVGIAVGWIADEAERTKEDPVANWGCIVPAIESFAQECRAAEAEPDPPISFGDIVHQAALKDGFKCRETGFLERVAVVADRTSDDWPFLFHALKNELEERIASEAFLFETGQMVRGDSARKYGGLEKKRALLVRERRTATNALRILESKLRLHPIAEVVNRTLTVLCEALNEYVPTMRNGGGSNESEQGA